MLNYRQLHYFWVVAKTGSIVRACEQLNLTPQTISGQISLLEQTFNIKLFRRVGRQLELTEAGRQTLPYAEHMFQLGGELELMLRAQPCEALRSSSMLCRRCSGSGWQMWCPSPSSIGCWRRPWS